MNLLLRSHVCSSVVDFSCIKPPGFEENAGQLYKSPAVHPLPWLEMWRFPVMECYWFDSLVFTCDLHHKYKMVYQMMSMTKLHMMSFGSHQRSQSNGENGHDLKHQKVLLCCHEDRAIDVQRIIPWEKCRCVDIKEVEEVLRCLASDADVKSRKYCIKL